MATAVVAANNSGRISTFLTVAVIPITITLSATAYATASGGFAFDLTGILAQGTGVGPYDSGINPLDILPNQPFFGFTSGKYIGANFALGTPTYSAPVDTSFGKGILATCPCTMRLYGTGASNAASFAEIADGNITDTVTGLLFVARGGNR